MSWRIYVASSWRNPNQQDVVQMLREDGHDVYDFKNPAPGVKGFAWSDIDPQWQSWTLQQFRDALHHPVARRGFLNDYRAMQWAEVGVMLMPCGRSAHLEAGYFVGAGKPLYIVLSPGEPELMYAMGKVCLNRNELRLALGGQAKQSTAPEDQHAL